MKKYFVSFLSVAFISATAVLPIVATSTNSYNFVGESGLNETAATTGHLEQRFFGQNGSIEGGIAVIISALLSVLGIVFFALMIWSGIMWMTAHGDAKKVDRAKDILLDSIVGIIIVSGAYAITYFVLGGIQGATLSGQIFSN